MRILNGLQREFIDRKMKAFSVSNKILTLPTLITSAGILCSLFYVLQFTFNVWLLAIPVTVALVGLSDLFDGVAARRLEQCSWLGDLIDSIRDRVILVAGAGNAALVSATAPMWLLASTVLLLEIYSFLRSDMPSYRKRKRPEEDPVKRYAYIAGFCIVLGATSHIYWGVPFVSPEGALALIALVSIIGAVRSDS